MLFRTLKDKVQRQNKENNTMISILMLEDQAQFSTQLVFLRYFLKTESDGKSRMSLGGLGIVGAAMEKALSPQGAAVSPGGGGRRLASSFT